MRRRHGSMVGEGAGGEAESPVAARGCGHGNSRCSGREDVGAQGRQMTQARDWLCQRR